MAEGATKERRWFTEGKWHGEYTYDPPVQVQPVSFRMQLRLGWFGFVKGTVQDESEWGTPDEGTIKGRVTGNGRISFVKRLPRLCVFNFDHTTGRVLDNSTRLVEGRHPLIHYLGLWEPDAKRLSGVWRMRDYLVQTGRWTAQPVERW